ncbi:MAG: hypothetical protein AB1758_33055 [Candidatus Eremiobacterota bacterium]
MRTIAVLLLGFLLTGWLEAGQVQGKVTLSAELEGARKARRKDQDRLLQRAGYERSEVDSDREGPAAFKRDEEAANVVVFLVGQGLPVGSPGTVILNQKDRRFVPHVLPVMAGATVQFPNDDRIFHHVYSTDPSFDFPKYPPTAAAPSKVPRRTVSLRSGEVPTVIELFCGIHSRMNAYLVVLPNRCFTRADAQGNYQIAGVPAGSYTLCAWHPRANPRMIKAPVTVPASGSVEANLSWK